MAACYHRSFGMITLFADGFIVDLFCRLPFAFGIDYLGAYGHTVSWGNISKNQSILEQELTWDVFAKCLTAVSVRLFFFLASIVCWMVVKFFPLTQMVLTAIWLEVSVIFAAILALNAATLSAPLHASLAIFVINQYLHSLFLLGLRKLRLMELMSLPVSIEYGSDSIEGLADTPLLAPWPRFALLTMFARIIVADPRFDGALYPSILGLTTLPATYFVMNALAWRIYSILHTLRLRATNDARFVIITPYYIAVDRVFWHSIGEDLVNQVYA